MASRARRRVVFGLAILLAAFSAAVGSPTPVRAAGTEQAGKPGSVTVFAAASTAGALDRAAEAFTARTGHRVTISYAGSSALARQIAAGAPADVFLSANPGWMDWLDEQGVIDAGTRRDLLGNSLVVIAHGPGAEPLAALQDLPARLGTARLAMALVDAVPAGQYGRAALESLGLWQTLAPRVAQADNVRAALALVATGAAPFGIVYATDAMAEPRVSVVARLDPSGHPPVRYPVAGIAGRGSPARDALLDFLGGAAAQQAFAEAGFSVPQHFAAGRVSRD